MLDDDVGHQLPVRVSLLVEAMHLVHLHIREQDLATVGASEDRSVRWVHGDGPDPVVQLADAAQEHAFSVPEGDLLITSRHRHVVALREEGHAAWVEAELLLVADLLRLLSALDRVEGQLLVPGAGHQEIVRGLKFLGAEGDGPDGRLAFVDGDELATCLVSQQYGAVEKANCEELSIGRPVARYALGRRLRLVHVLTLRHPEAEVDARARSQSLQDWVEAQGLDLLTVCVLEEALAL